MGVKAERIRRGLWRAAKWLPVILVILHVGWLVGLVPKPPISAASYVVPAYFSDPDPECRAQPTPECLADMAEQSIYDIYDHFGDYPIEAEYVGSLHARLGDFERADRLAAWLEERRTWDLFEDGTEAPATPYYDQKVGYFLSVGKWREALAMVADFRKQKGVSALSNCDQMQNIALGLAVDGAGPDANEVLGFMSEFGCDEDIEGYERTYNTLSDTRRSVELLMLLHLPREEAMQHADYQNALWEWPKQSPGYFHAYWKAPPALAGYCDLLTSIDPYGQMEVWQLRVLMNDLLKAGAIARAKIVLKRMASNPEEKAWLLDWLQDRHSEVFYRGGAVVRFVLDNYLSDDERRQVAQKVAMKAAWNLEMKTVEWAKPYLSAAEYESALREYEVEKKHKKRMWWRMARISENYRHDQAGALDELRALSDEYIWRWYQVPISNFGIHVTRNLNSQISIVSMLFEYGAYDDGFELIRKLAYHPGALTSAAWGLTNQASSRSGKFCPSH